MLANITLTTIESKKLIAKATVKHPIIAKALKSGIVVIHPSSTTAFVYQEIVGSWPTGAWLFGTMCNRGLCRSNDAIRMLQNKDPNNTPRKQWVFINGELQDAIPLGDILNKMGPDDVFVKSANAIDYEGNLATLSSNPAEGGTSGKVLKSQKEKHFHIIMPTGLDKIIPTSIDDVIEKIGSEKPELSMGLACGVFPIHGAEKLDERDAFKLLYDVDCVVGASGGVSGAEGAVCIYITGETDKVSRAFDFAESIKGTVLPEVDLPTEI